MRTIVEGMCCITESESNKKLEINTENIDADQSIPEMIQHAPESPTMSRDCDISSAGTKSDGDQRNRHKSGPQPEVHRKRPVSRSSSDTQTQGPTQPISLPTNSVNSQITSPWNDCNN